MKIDFKEILPLVDITDLPDGTFDREYRLADGRSVELKARITVHGSRIRNYCDPDDTGYFNGSVEFVLLDWTGYDPDGREIPVTNYAYFQNMIETLIRQAL